MGCKRPDRVNRRDEAFALQVLFNPVVPVLLLVGAFYALAGMMAMRAVLSTRLIDVAMSAISGKRPARHETLQHIWLLISSLMISAGGIALLLRMELAAALFVISAGLQILYLLIAAPYYFDVLDPPDPKGRAATINAAILYGAATLFVLWAYAGGLLLPIEHLPPLLLAVAGMAVLASIVYAGRRFVWGVGQGESPDRAEYQPESHEDE